jgi:hypothetical protein
MTCDHIGVQLFPKLLILRIIGRLALPIFAYMIAQGCRYTKNKKKYLLTIAAVALVCQLVYFFAMQSLYQCILVTFSLSICLIFALDAAIQKPSIANSAFALCSFATVWFIGEGLPKILPGFYVDYGFMGILLPVLIWLGRNKWESLILCGIGLVLLSIGAGIQWFSLLTLPILALYNGARGKAKLKYLFYIYYPAHLVVIYLVSLLLGGNL